MNYNLFLLLTATFVGGVAGATAIYAGQSPNRSGTAATLIGGLVASIGAFIVVATREGTELFGLLHLAYLIITIGVPMAALGLAINWKHQQFLGRTVAILGLLVAPLGLYASHIEPFWLRVDDVAVPAPSSMAGLRIGVLADLQATEIGDYERDAITQLISEAPDIVLVPGDFWQMTDEAFTNQAPAFAAELARIDAAVPHVFMVRGNTDSVEGLRLLAQGTDVIVLDNEVADVDVNGQAVRVGGITLSGDESRARAAIRQLTGRTPPSRTTTNEAATAAADQMAVEPEISDDEATEPPTTDEPLAPETVELPPPADDVFRILLAHKPDEIDRLPGDDSVNLIVAGHTHGGQIRFPGFPPPVTLSSVPRTVGGGGLHRLDDHWIYVSTGVGRERGRAPQVRLGVRPSIGVLTTIDVTSAVLPDDS